MVLTVEAAVDVAAMRSLEQYHIAIGAIMREPNIDAATNVLVVRLPAITSGALAEYIDEIDAQPPQQKIEAERDQHAGSARRWTGFGYLLRGSVGITGFEIVR